LHYNNEKLNDASRTASQSAFIVFFKYRHPFDLLHLFALFPAPFLKDEVLSHEARCREKIVIFINKLQFYFFEAAPDLSLQLRIHCFAGVQILFVK